MSKAKATPMMKQYLSIKAEHPDSILFYRMGDFYEMFLEDAKVASRILEIALTSRNKNADDPIDMCGFPIRAVDGYIARLIEHGHKVAVCEQVEDPATAKGLVKREVVRIVTPGMVLDENILDKKSNNFCLALAKVKDRTGIAYLDISTGSFRLSEYPNPGNTVSGAAVDECRRIAPSEVIFPDTALADPFFAPAIEALKDKSVTYVDGKNFHHRRCRELLLEQFRTRSLEGFGCEKLAAGTAAAGALLSYVQEHQLQKIEHLTGIETYHPGNHLLMDDLSCRNLELTANLRTGSRNGTLLSVIDRTVTAMGGRLLKRWIRYPLMDPAAIGQRLDAIEEARDALHLRQNIREGLKEVFDLERLSSKIAMGHANARDFTALKRSIGGLSAIWDDLCQLSAPLFSGRDLLTEDGGLDLLKGLESVIESAIREDAPVAISDGGIIRKGYDPELDELIQISSDGKGWLARLEAEEREKTGIGSLKVKYNKVFGYFIEISRANAKLAPEHYVRKQTLVNAERYITDELKTFESKVLTAEEERGKLEYTIFCDIRDKIVANNGLILSAARFLAELDVIFGLADLADGEDYCRPAINDDGIVSIVDGRHPVVEKMVAGERYIPNSILLDNSENQVLVITGPNMAGKSTILRQVALTVLMAQMGGFVPAAEANIAVTDRIFTRVGALDNLSQGQSTFMVEMEETANIINNASPKSLIVMDEIGRGTSTFDGLSIAWAVAEHLHDLRGAGVKTLFATHYHELTELSGHKARVKNFNIAVKEIDDTIIFLRKLVAGGTNRSYGIQVARLAGIPSTVIAKAKGVLSSIEERGHRPSPAAEPAPYPKPAASPKKAKTRQLALFSEPGNEVIEKLKGLDISSMTPLDALNYLNTLKEEAKATGCV